MAVELWQLRYVVAVGEELNFTRAAERLHISQPALSTRIRELEQRLGFDLFLRSSRHVALTPAGEELMRRARSILTDVDAATTAARNIATTLPVLRVGVLGSAGAALFPLVSARLHEMRPGVRLEPRQLSRPDQIDAGDADIAFTRLEPDETDLAVAPILRERRVVALPTTHSLAGRRELRMADLTEEKFLTQRAETNPRYRRRWLSEQRRHGLGAAIAREVADPEELFALLTTGGGICLVPATLARYHARPGLTYIPVVDADTVGISLAWRTASAQPLLAQFVDAARAVAAELLSDPAQDEWLPTTVTDPNA